MAKQVGPQIMNLPYTERIANPKYQQVLQKLNLEFNKMASARTFKNPFYGKTVGTSYKEHPFTKQGDMRIGTGGQGSGALPNDPVDRQRWLNMQDSEKGIEFLKGLVRSKNITIDQAGEVLQFVQGKHPSQEVKQPMTFQKAWKMWYVTSPQYQQALDKNKKERQKVQRQLDKVTQDNEKIKSANQQMPLNQRTPKKSFILGPDGKPASI